MTESQRPLVLISGASSGLRTEFARAFAAQEYDLLLTARRLDRTATPAGTAKYHRGD
ncbi:MAG: hypothetical protein WCO83_09185 [Alphaproteobacteria bacterium]